MKVSLFPVVLFFVSLAHAQDGGSTVIPTITRLSPDPHTVMVLHLSPGYATSVKLPEEVNSVVVGNPATFKCEHSEAEPRLVFFKPITTQPSESNALITMKSGKTISFYLTSRERQSTEQKIDFLIEYDEPQSLLGRSADLSSFLIPESGLHTDPVSVLRDTSIDKTISALEQALAEQKRARPLSWKGKELEATVGASREDDRRTILSFSVRNASARTVEILPPQIQLSGSGSNRRKEIKAEPVPILQYRMTSRRLAPGERADGVIAFDRPNFKQSAEELKLQLAEAEQVDRPLLLPFSFTPTMEVRNEPSSK